MKKNDRQDRNGAEPINFRPTLDHCMVSLLLLLVAVRVSHQSTREKVSKWIHGSRKFARVNEPYDKKSLRRRLSPDLKVGGIHDAIDNHPTSSSHDQSAS